MENLILAGIDAGGPAREYMYLLAEELVDKLKLFIPTPNQVENVGSERNKVYPNYLAFTEVDLENFFKFGFILGAIYQSGEIINIDLPSILTKYLLGKTFIALT